MEWPGMEEGSVKVHVNLNPCSERSLVVNPLLHHLIGRRKARRHLQRRWRLQRTDSKAAGSCGDAAASRKLSSLVGGECFDAVLACAFEFHIAHNVLVAAAILARRSY